MRYLHIIFLKTTFDNACNLELLGGEFPYFIGIRKFGLMLYKENFSLDAIPFARINLVISINDTSSIAKILRNPNTSHCSYLNNMIKANHFTTHLSLFKHISASTALIVQRKYCFPVILVKHIILEFIIR